MMSVVIEIDSKLAENELLSLLIICSFIYICICNHLEGCFTEMFGTFVGRSTMMSVVIEIDSKLVENELLSLLIICSFIYICICNH
jgi:hypothetical protein